ncbi:MAG TPA: hypothetical protein DDY98_00915 [Ruminococcaceae bacterium]|nr:hypothetical protein [Oscillospiraceae bacterium]
MGIKSKKFKYKPLKAAAFLLCLVFAGTGALSVCRLADFANRSGYYFASDLGITDATNNMFDARYSKDYLDEMGFVYYAAKRVFITYRNGAVFHDGTVKTVLQEAYTGISETNAEKELAEAKSTAADFNDFFRRLPNESLLEKEGKNVDADGDGTLRDDVKNEDGLCLNDFENSDNFVVKANRVYPNARYFEALKKRIESVNVDGEVAAARNEYGYLKNYLDSLKAVRFLIVNDQTGEVFSNSDSPTVLTFAEKYAQSDWFISSSDNFDTAVVGSVFSSMCSRLRADTDQSEHVVFTLNGSEVNNCTYTEQLIQSMHYGYESKISSVVLGVTTASRQLSGTPCTVCLSYNYSRVAVGDPFNTLTEDYIHSATSVSQYFAVLLLSALLVLALAAVLVIFAGRDYKNAPVHMKRIDKFPSDLRFFLSVGLTVLLVALGGTSMFLGLSKPSYSMIFTIGTVAFSVAAVAVLLDYLMFLSRNIKNNSLFSHMVLALPFRLTQRFVKRLTGNESDLPDGIKRQFKVALPFYLFLTIFDMFFIIYEAEQRHFFAVFLMLLWFGSIQLAFISLLFSYAKSLDKIRDTVQATQSGDFDMQFDTEKMPKSMVNFAENISDMRQDMKEAMQAAVQDQRTKTELITNVSHDLKTPLTSIITYTDLIQNSDLQDETVKGYAQVLSEKSLRLKQLIEDLTEASKLSGGNVEIHLTPVSLYELAVQAIAENEDYLEAADIEVLLAPGEQRPIVLADGQKTYRVFENILSNIAKYAKSGTKAFVTVEQDNSYGVITFVNTTDVPLNCTAEHLMERFVRGDSARGGEGSGLGLSITKDLCRLQGGLFRIAIEGDEFKAIVRLPLVKSEQATRPAEDNAGNSY